MNNFVKKLLTVTQKLFFKYMKYPRANVLLGIIEVLLLMDGCVMDDIFSVAKLLTGFQFFSVLAHVI